MTSIALDRSEIGFRSTTDQSAGPSAKQQRRITVALWVAQGLLAALFVFAGAMKFIMPVAEMTKQLAFPGWFLHFIGLAEVLGGLGLVLPGIFRTRTGLTPLAAAGLVIIMTGATVTTLTTPAPAGAIVPFVVGLIATSIAYGRSRVAPLARRSYRA